ncbi:MAG: hypothetical protein ACE5IY_18925 [bacterium]
MAHFFSSFELRISNFRLVRVRQCNSLFRGYAADSLLGEAGGRQVPHEQKNPVAQVGKDAESALFEKG